MDYTKGLLGFNVVFNVSLNALLEYLITLESMSINAMSMIYQNYNLYSILYSLQLKFNAHFTDFKLINKERFFYLHQIW